jgi:hypothetical protein
MAATVPRNPVLGVTCAPVSRPFSDPLFLTSQKKNPLLLPPVWIPRSLHDAHVVLEDSVVGHLTSSLSFHCVVRETSLGCLGPSPLPTCTPPSVRVVHLASSTLSPAITLRQHPARPSLLPLAAPLFDSLLPNFSFFLSPGSFFLRLPVPRKTTSSLSYRQKLGLPSASLCAVLIPSLDECRT